MNLITTIGGRDLRLSGPITAIPVRHGPALVSMICADGGVELAREMTTSDRPTQAVFVFHSFSGNKDEITIDPALTALLSIPNAVIICPDLFGPAGNPGTCGSPAQLRRALGWIEWAQVRYGIAAGNVWAAGVSGGAGLGPQFIGAYPDVISKASFWCGYFDLAEWYAFSNANGLGYDAYMREAIGGPPTGALAATYRAQSPSGTLGGARNCTIYINDGRLDVSIPPAQRTEMRDALLALPSSAGITCNYIAYPAMGHAVDWAAAVAQLTA